MTKRKASVARAKREAYFRLGTCARCKVSIVVNASGFCRRCRPVLQEQAELAAQEALEAEKGTLYFRYWLTVRKKDPSDIGILARAFLADKALGLLRGLDAIAAATTAEQVDVRVLEDAWAQSEAERKAQT